MFCLLVAAATALVGSHPFSFTPANGQRIHEGLDIHLVHDLIDEASVASLLSTLPKDESSWLPCIGQTQEFNTKKCAHIPASAAFLRAVSETWSIDTAKLAERGLPVIRYIPGSGAVGVHGDIDHHGVVPNATIVVYLTSAEHDDGHTHFPELGVRVRPRAGSALSFQNVDALGAPDPRARHGVEAVSKHASRDRVVVQIPIRESTLGTSSSSYRWEAYPEHVSGMKHTAHMGVMVLVLLGFGAYSWWQSWHDGGSVASLKAVGHAALRVVGEVGAVDGRL